MTDRSVPPQPALDRLGPMLQDIFEWDVKTWSRSLRLWAPVLEEVSSGTRVLELGARRAGLSQMFAALGADVLATDLREPTEDLALADLPGRIRRLQLDATDFGPEIGEFDVICFKSVLGGVGDRHAQERMAASIRRALAPGGAVLFAENLTGSRVHMALRRRFVGWGNSWTYVTVDELGEIFGSGDLDLETFGLVPPLPGRLGALEPLRNSPLIQAADRLVPATWHYVAAGVARPPR